MDRYVVEFCSRKTEDEQIPAANVTVDADDTWVRFIGINTRRTVALYSAADVRSVTLHLGSGEEV